MGKRVSSTSLSNPVTLRGIFKYLKQKKVMSNFKDRLKKEFDDLGDKIHKLNEFLRLRDATLEKIGEVQFSLLISQLAVMEAYHTILYRRLSNLNK
jgi:hypothetical protein